MVDVARERYEARYRCVETPQEYGVWDHEEDDWNRVRLDQDSANRLADKLNRSSRRFSARQRTTDQERSVWTVWDRDYGPHGNWVRDCDGQEQAERTADEWNQRDAQKRNNATSKHWASNKEES